MAEPAKAVAEWIKENFEPESVTASDFPAFPYGKLLTDRQGKTMVVFYDIMTGKVTWRFPDGDPQEP